MTEYYPILEMYQALRGQLMSVIDDADLSFTPGGSNMTLGALCREMGEVQVTYIESLRTFKHDLDFRRDADAQVGERVAAFAAWYEALDAEMKEVVAGLSDDDVSNRLVERGPEFKLPPRIHLTVYTEALLIFYGKATVYLRALEKTTPGQWQEWIG